MPITENVYLGLYENKTPADVVRSLMSRNLKSELEFTGARKI